MLKTRKETNAGGFVVRVNRFAPGPVMVRFLSITNSPLVRLTVVTLGAKLIVSLDEALRIACRNDPGPLSLPFTTVMVAACTGIATAYSFSSTSANVVVRLI